MLAVAPLLLGAAAEDAPTVAIVLTPGVMSEASGTGSVTVDVTVSGWTAPANMPLFRIGVMAPGMPDPQPVQGFVLDDAAGRVPTIATETDGNREWRAMRNVAGTLHAHYVLPIDNRRGSGPPVALRIDGDAFSATGRALLAIPTLPIARATIGWHLDAMGPGAVGVSSWGDGDVALPTGRTERLGEALFMAGHLHRVEQGSFAAVWTGEAPFDPRSSMLWTAGLHRWMSRFFGDTTEPPYRVFLRGNPQNPGGGAAMFHSFIVGYGDGTTGENLKSILGHEMTHTWTANDAIGKWYTEGDAVYYQAQLAWRAGLVTTDQYLADLNRTASRYYTDAKRATPEDQVMSHFWDDTRIRVLPYDRGALYFAALDGMLRRRSGDARSIDELIRAMNARRDRGETLSEADWVKAIEREIGPGATALHRTMMAGGLVLPRSEDFGPCFRRVVVPIRQFDIGFDWSSLSGDKMVTGLNPASEAARAGVRNGDRIVSIGAGDAVQADVTRTTTLSGVRAGKPFTITYLPRGRAVPAYQWRRIPSIPDRLCRPSGPAMIDGEKAPSGV